VIGAGSRIRVGWKRAASESGNYQWTNLPSGYKYTVIGLFRGCATTGDPANVACSNTTYTTSNTTIRAAGITTDDACALVWVGGIQVNGTITKPTNFTKADNENDPGYYDLLLGYRLAVAAGATGDVDGVSSASTTSKHGFLIALEPPAAAAVKHPLMMMGVG
jgi:hypothetical protein